MKHARILLVAAILLLSFSALNIVFGQSTNSSYTVKLNSYTLQVTYPSEALPGDNITISVQGTPNAYGVYLQSLTVTIYYADSLGLHQLAAQNLVVSNPPNAYNNYVSYGNSGSFSKNFTVNVPENTPRTSLVALFSQSATFGSYYSYAGNGLNPYYYTNPYPFSYPFYPYYPSYMSYAYYPYSYSTPQYGSDQAVAPLSYIKANTPESVTLQSENQMLQQQLSQAQGQNQALQTRLSQQNATINQLDQQVADMNGTIQTYQMLSLGLGILAVIFLVFTISQRRGKRPHTVEAQASS